MASRPIALDDSFDFFEDQVISGNLLANDQDPAGGTIYLRYFDGIRVDGKHGPAQETQIAGDYGIFKVKPDGSFTYQLDPSIVLNDGDTLVETLSTKIASAGGTDVGRLTLTIHGKSPPPTPTQYAPVANADRFEFDEGGSYTGNVLANDYDQNGDILSLRSFNGVPVDGKHGRTHETQIAGDHGVFMVRPDGSFTYLPNPGEEPGGGASLTETFNLKISDGHGGMDVSSFTLVINGDLPVLINQTIDDEKGTPGASEPSISSDGRLIAFDGLSANPSDPYNDLTDILVLDRETHTFTNITEGDNGHSFDPSMSADGTLIAFTSEATNLVAGDLGTQYDVFLYDVANDTFRNVTQGGNGFSGSPQLSANGATLIFQSAASNLTPNDTNNATDLFVYDVATGALANLGPIGFEAPSVSDDGSKVILKSLAALVPEDTDALADVYLYDVASGGFTLVSGDVAGDTLYPVLSPDGSTAAFSAVDGFTLSAYIYDVASGQTTNIAPFAEVNSFTEIEGFSADGKKLVFISTADNLSPYDIEYLTEPTSDVFVYDVDADAITSITKGAFGYAHQAAISRDGSTVVFASDAAELTPGVPYDGEHRYRYDVASGRLIFMAPGLSSSGGAPFENDAVMSDDGSVIAFDAYTGLGDERGDLFTYELL